MIEYVEVCYDNCPVETDLAFLLIIDDDKVWVPRSVMESGMEPAVEDGEGYCHVARWFAEKEGLV